MYTALEHSRIQLSRWHEPMGSPVVGITTDQPGDSRKSTTIPSLDQVYSTLLRRDHRNQQ